MSARPGANAPVPSPTDDLEASLEKAFDADPTPAQLAAIDRRVAAAVKTPRRPTRRLGRPGRRWGSVLLAAAALVVLVGFVGARATLVSMYPIATQGSNPLAWERSTKLGISQVHDGYKVTLDAAYADAAQTMLAISIVDTATGRESQVGFGRLDLTDEAGRTYQMTEGGSQPVGSSSSVNMVWFQTPGDGVLSGTHHFVLTMPDIGVRAVTPPFSTLPGGLSMGDPWGSAAGPWRFEFDLAIAPGTRLSPASTATVDGVTVTLGSVLVAPTTVRLQFRCDGLPDSGSGWAPVGAVVHNGAQLAIGTSWGSLDPKTWQTTTTETGTDNASGSWTVRIDELVGESPQGQIRLEGPWELQFEAP